MIGTTASVLLLASLLSPYPQVKSSQLTDGLDSTTIFNVAVVRLIIGCEDFAGAGKVILGTAGRVDAVPDAPLGALGQVADASTVDGSGEKGDDSDELHFMCDCTLIW